MSAWWDENHELLLLTPAEFAELADGEILTCIDGSTAIKGADTIDDDTRGGHLAYGVVGDHPLRLAHLSKMAAMPKPVLEPLPEHKVWQCKIGVMGSLELPPGADGPMRRAIEDAFFQLTGRRAEFNFSGWGARLDRYEIEVVRPNAEAI